MRAGGGSMVAGSMAGSMAGVEFVCLTGLTWCRDLNIMKILCGLPRYLTFGAVTAKI